MVKTSSAQESKDSIPDYSYFLEQLDSGNTDIDYRLFRISYLYSEDFRNKGLRYDTLKRVVYDNIQKEDYDAIIEACNEMLTYDYTSMFAHKYLQHTAKIIGDSLLYHKHHDIEFGLLKSIVRSGDAKTCASAWEVTQLEEEYFILRMVGAQLKKQILEGGCDKMIVKKDRQRAVYYFNVYYVFLGRKLLYNPQLLEDESDTVNNVGLNELLIENIEQLDELIANLILSNGDTIKISKEDIDGVYQAEDGKISIQLNDDMTIHAATDETSRALRAILSDFGIDLIRD